jgi:hypothetical protein
MLKFAFDKEEEKDCNGMGMITTTRRINLPFHVAFDIVCCPVRWPSCHPIVGWCLQPMMHRVHPYRPACCPHPVMDGTGGGMPMPAPLLLAGSGCGRLWLFSLASAVLASATRGGGGGMLANNSTIKPTNSCCHVREQLPQRQLQGILRHTTINITGIWQI